MEVGDKVNYVPSIDHALDRLPDGNYCWEFQGLDKHNQPVTLTTKRIEEVVYYLNTFRGRADLNRSRLLMPIKPRVMFDATVKEVNPDGTVVLTIQHCRSGIVLEYNNIKADETSKAPHTCHKA